MTTGAPILARARRGLLLMEALLALAIFVMIGIAILAMVHNAAATVSRSRDAARAADLARSAMAMLESGIATPQTLSGPVPTWAEAQERGDALAFGFGGDAASAQQPWELEIETEPSQFDGLTLVTVRAIRRIGGGDQIAAGYTLRQLVRLDAAAEDDLGGDPLALLAEGGER